jgi:phosphoribosylglycinamide formyltransferase-1
MRNIAIFASGSGTNAENIIRHFSDSSRAKVKLILSNKADAYVLERARKYGINHLSFNREQFRSGEVLETLRSAEIDYIILAGFLWLMPADILAEYDGRVINVHPALLPNYGGKGMYGDNVHKAVVAAGEKFSGITVHLVNERYDSGDILWQATVRLELGETPDSLAQKIHTLEYAYFPIVAENEINRIFYPNE